MLCIYLSGQDLPVAAQLSTFRPYLFRQMFLTLLHMNFESVPKKIGRFFYFAYTPTFISFMNDISQYSKESIQNIKYPKLMKKSTILYAPLPWENLY